MIIYRILLLVFQSLDDEVVLAWLLFELWTAEGEVRDIWEDMGGMRGEKKGEDEKSKEREGTYRCIHTSP